MVEEFPGNSNRKKAAEEPKVEQKKVDRVVTGEVVRRKKPWGKRFKEFFTGDDTQSVADYVMFDVALPALKDMVADVVSQGIERKLFGESRSSSRRRASSAPYGHVAYNRPGAPIIGGGRREDPRGPSMSRRGRATHDFDEVVLATRHEAEEVIDRLFDLVSRYDAATVSDLYDLLGISGQYTDEKYGWTDMRGASVTRIKGGYLLNLPRPVLLD
jgi:hypothetical protein